MRGPLAVAVALAALAAPAPLLRRPNATDNNATRPDPALAGCQRLLYAPEVVLRLDREQRSEEYRLQLAGRAARQVCAQAGRKCASLRKSVDAALQVGLLASYHTFCEEVFGPTSMYRPLFPLHERGEAPRTDAQGQQQCEQQLARLRSSELSTPHAASFLAYDVCLGLPKGWRLQPEASLLQADQKTEVWPWEQLPPSARSVNPFRRLGLLAQARASRAGRGRADGEGEQRQLNPFQQAWRFAKGGLAPAAPAPAPRVAEQRADPADLAEHQRCLVFEKFVGQLFQQDLTPERYCEALSPHFAAAKLEASVLGPDDPQLLFRGSPVEACASKLAQQGGKPDLPALATAACEQEVGQEQLEKVDCGSFGEFVKFLVDRGDLTEQAFCGLFASDWDTFADGGAWAYATCLETLPAVLSMDVATPVLASSVFDVCAEAHGQQSDGFSGSRVPRALACAPLRRAVLDLRPKGLMFPETVCHSLAPSVHPDAVAFDTCASRLESVVALQALSADQQADLLAKDCGQGQGKHPQVCQWVRQAFLDLNKALAPSRATGTMLCSLLENAEAKTQKCFNALHEYEQQALTAPEQVEVAFRACVGQTGDPSLCHSLAQKLSQGEAVDAGEVCAVLATGEGETARRAWVAQCTSDLAQRAQLDEPLAAVCFSASMQQRFSACERVLAEVGQHQPYEVCEEVWRKHAEKQCLLTPWSDWTPCAKCGQGSRTRRRLVLHDPHQSCGEESLVATSQCPACPAKADGPFAPPTVPSPAVGRSATQLWIQQDPPVVTGGSLVKLEVAVTKDGGGEVFRQDLGLDASWVLVDALEPETRYSVQVDAQYATEVALGAPRDGDSYLQRPRTRVTAATSSEPTVVSTLEPARCANVDCGLNGLCVEGACVCGLHWSGDRCETRMTLNQTLWQSGQWSDCSAQCDGGEQYRRVTCVSLENGNGRDAFLAAPQVRPEYECIADQRPLETRPCRLSHCGAWRASLSVTLGDPALSYLTSHLAEQVPDGLVADLEGGLAAALGVDREHVSLALSQEDSFAALERLGGLGAGAEPAALQDDDQDLDDAGEQDEQDFATDFADDDQLDDDDDVALVVQKTSAAPAQKLQDAAPQRARLEVEFLAATQAGCSWMVRSYLAQLQLRHSPLQQVAPLFARVEPDSVPSDVLDVPVEQLAQRAVVASGEGPALVANTSAEVRRDVLEAASLHATAQRQELSLRSKANEVLANRENGTAARNRFGDPTRPLGDQDDGRQLATTKAGGAGWMATDSQEPAVVFPAFHGRALWTGSRTRRVVDEVFPSAAAVALAVALAL